MLEHTYHRVSGLVQLYFDIKWSREFEEDLLEAVKTSQPSLDQILLIARTRQVKTASVYWILQRMLREILTGREATLLQHRGVIEKYIAAMDEAEPFEGMPSQIRIHLERLREQVPDARVLLDPLTAQIRELLAVNEKDKKQQRYYTVGGFILGVVGLFFAAIAYFFPYTNSVPAAQPPASAASAPK